MNKISHDDDEDQKLDTFALQQVYALSAECAKHGFTRNDLVLIVLTMAGITVAASSTKDNIEDGLGAAELLIGAVARAIMKVGHEPGRH